MKVGVLGHRAMRESSCFGVRCAPGLRRRGGHRRRRAAKRVAEHTPSLSGATQISSSRQPASTGFDGLDLVFSALPHGIQQSSPTSTGASVRSSTWPPTSG